MLTIAGFDPSSGAGITADLATMAAHHYFGTSAITALTVQSTQGVLATFAVGHKILTQTLDHLVADIPPAGIKIGMLANGVNVRAVAAFLRRLRETAPKIPVVLDPVMLSSSNRELLDYQGTQLLRDELLGLVDWVTPNVAELASLARGAVPDAARLLSSGHPRLNVVVTGGDQDANDYVSLTGGYTGWLSGEKIDSQSTHGTGCAFSTALLCRLCDNYDALDAIRAAKHYVEQAILQAPGIGSGHGPLNLGWPLRPE